MKDGKSSKRQRSIFDAVEALELQDDVGELTGSDGVGTGRMQKARKTKKRRSDTRSGNSKDKLIDVDDNKDSDLAVTAAEMIQSHNAVYSRLMECRILLQRVMDHLPQHQVIQQHQDVDSISNTDDGKATTSKEHDDAIQECDKLLHDLWEARIQLNGRRHIESINTNGKEKDSSSVPVDTEDGKHIDWSSRLASEYEPLRESWKDVLNRHHKTMQLHAGLVTAKTSSFQVLNASFWQHVEARVQHEQLQQQQQNLNATGSSFSIPQFQDVKLYQHLLQDFVSARQSSHQGQAVSWAQQRLSSSSTRSGASSIKMVDRRASKGRQIRYAEIPKLLHFTFPVRRSTASSLLSSNGSLNNAFLNQDEWFKSLLGGAARVVQNSHQEHGAGI